ncbi:MAG: hypothetical protein H7Y37_04075 [Anaerolineae bacterium]|nr:hypothetical protein [Gloeobacterales cyanobacterium ES-bin-313]
MDPVELPPQNFENAPEPTPEEITLWGEIKKGVEWVVFVGKMLKRMGGPVIIFRSISFVLIKLLRRTLLQWGWLKS